MKRLVRDVGLLLLTGALALSTTLAWRHWTSAAIADAEKQLNSRQRLAVLPEGSYDNQPLDSPLPRPAAQRQTAASWQLTGQRWRVNRPPSYWSQRSRAMPGLSC